MTNQTRTTQRTACQLIPAVGATVRVRFESVAVDCYVQDAKNSYGKVRLLVAPLQGEGAQWIELERLVALKPSDCDEDADFETALARIAASPRTPAARRRMESDRAAALAAMADIQEAR